MAVLNWRKDRDPGGGPQIQGESVVTEWDEVWTVLSYVPPLLEPGWVGLLIDRPDLAPGNPHPIPSLGAYVTRFDPQPIGTSPAWTVKVSYRNGDPRSRDLPPTQRPAVIETSTESLEVPTFRKASGDPWINTAGDLIAGITKKKTRIIFNVQKNVSAVPAWALSYADAVNSDAVNIRGLAIAAGYLLLGDLRVGNLTQETVNSLNYLYFPISFTLTYDPDDWKTRVYNRGLYQYDGTDYKPCVDSEGEPVSEPAFLDGAGAQLPFPVNPASIVTLEDWSHDQLPFSVLPLT